MSLSMYTAVTLAKLMARFVDARFSNLTLHSQIVKRS